MTARPHEFHSRLRRWYRAHGRHDLPWRQTADPYAIWVSEVMLQQTQVKTVRERFYFPFLKRFPTIEALAGAELQEVLTLWQGLGYYTRARNIHRAAQELSTGVMPEDLESLQKLPGVGRNTAHAIAAFAFRRPVPVMEANVKRVLSRVFALEQPGDKALWERAEAVMDKKNPFDYNQAMMDLGALLCTPVAPDCPACPANGICQGKNNPTAYPQKKTKKTLPVVRQKIVVFYDGYGRIFMQPREGDFLHGLWQFYETELTNKIIHFNNKKYEVNVESKLGFVTHAYSHFRLEAEVYAQAVDEVPGGKTLTEIAVLPLSRTEKKILALLRNHENRLLGHEVRQEPALLEAATASA